MTPKLISKDRVLEIAQNTQVIPLLVAPLGSYYAVVEAFAAALEAELLERLGQGWEGRMRTWSPRECYQAGAANALRQQVEHIEPFDMQGCFDFWNEYSALSEMYQDEMNEDRLAWLDRMERAAAPQDNEKGEEA